MNQCIHVAIAEKLARLQHGEWFASRSKPSKERVARALAILDKPTGNAPEPGDLLPPRYVSLRRTDEYRRTRHCREAYRRSCPK